MRVALALLLFLTIVPAARADAPTPAEAAARHTLESFGQAHEACLEWTDGCAVCARQPDKSFGCSLPGIACQPGKVTCSKPPETKPDAPSKSPKP